MQHEGGFVRNAFGGHQYKFMIIEFLQDRLRLAADFFPCSNRTKLKLNSAIQLTGARSLDGKIRLQCNLP
jgi:hypothetical protein